MENNMGLPPYMTHAIVNERLLGRRLQWRPGKYFLRNIAVMASTRSRGLLGNRHPLVMIFYALPIFSWPDAAPASVKRIQH
jgi:hypothetical protein